MLTYLDLSRLSLCLAFKHIFKIEIDCIGDYWISRLEGIYHS